MKLLQITAIPALLALLDIQEAIITIDPMVTQTDIVRLLREKKADYVLTLKGNHPTLYTQVKNWFIQAQSNHFECLDVSYV
ncbi:ISAs1 family transposase [Planktothricoides sp. FACHB-1370]|uniref:ISAs1 family transposase n=1 Tax=Planktothricoides raciborskii FACHB-1370 TaxID=2949576 RepID=A0ABR8E6C0_9CYAN|nr:ISAs1 family transposase [Planktothricoides raciborskii FACHB-1370]MBD2582027.1 ISAs1 family transposase [Planktothricoides raciborskii FACHB-1261]